MMQQQQQQQQAAGKQQGQGMVPASTNVQPQQQQQQQLALAAAGAKALPLPLVRSAEAAPAALLNKKRKLPERLPDKVRHCFCYLLYIANFNCLKYYLYFLEAPKSTRNSGKFWAPYTLTNYLPEMSQVLRHPP